MLGLRRVQPMSIMPWRDDYTRGMFTNGDLQSREPGGSSLHSLFLKTGKIFISFKLLFLDSKYHKAPWCDGEVDYGDA